MTINFGTIKQGSLETVAFTLPLGTATIAPDDLTGATLSGTMTQAGTDTTTSITGTVAITDGVARAASWALAAEDVGTAGAFLVVIRAVLDGVPIYTLNGIMVVEENPAVTAVAAPPLVGVPVVDAAWLAGAKTAVPDAADLADIATKQDKDTDATDGYLAVFANGQTVAGSGAPGSAAYASTSDFDADGAAAAAQAASQPVDADLTTIAALANTDGNFIVGSPSGWVAESGATARASLGLGTIATAGAGDYYLQSAFSASPVAAEPLKANGVGGIQINGESLFEKKDASTSGVSGVLNLSRASTGLAVAGFGCAQSYFVQSGATIGEVGRITVTNPQAFRSGTMIFSVSQGGAPLPVMAIGYPSNVAINTSGTVVLDTQLHITARSAATNGLVVKLATSHTANSFEVRNGTDNSLFLVNALGKLELGQKSTSSHEISGKLESSTTANTQAARIAWSWGVNTHASRTTVTKFYNSDYAGEREVIATGANGTGATLGFYGVTPTARQLLATGTGATVDNIITALQNLGLLKQS